MWKVFSLALLATAAATPTQTKDDIVQSPLMTKFDNPSRIVIDTSSLLEKNCNKYGSKDTFTNIQQSLATMQRGLLADLASEIKKDFAKKQVSSYISIACSIILNPSFKEQLDNLFRSLKQCVEPKYKQLFNLNFEPIELACSNDGKIVTSFIKEGGVECIKKQEQKIEKCIKELLIYKNYYYKNIDSLFEDQKKMSKIKTLVKECATEELRHCLSTSSVKLIASLLDKLFPQLIYLTVA